MFATPTEEQLAAYFDRCQIEVIVIVEGTHAETASSIQARQSYKLEDMVFNETFAPCVFIGDEGDCLLNFKLFHDRVPAPPCEEDPFVQSIL